MKRPKPAASARWNVRSVPVDFGPAVTAGAIRCEATDGGFVLTPLPDAEPFDVAVRLTELPGGGTKALAAVEAVDAEGRRLRTLDFEARAGLVRFTTRRGEFAYRLTPAAK